MEAPEQSNFSWERALRIIQGVRLSFTGKADLSSSNFTIKAKQPIFHYDWLEKVVSTPQQARTLAIGLCWSKYNEYGLNLDSAKSIFEDWDERVQRPALVFSDYSIESLNDVKVLFSENSFGPYIVNQVNSRKIHPVSYCYLNKIFNASGRWTTLNWKMYKHRFDVTEKVLDLNMTKVLSLAKCIKTKIGESNE